MTNNFGNTYRSLKSDLLAHWIDTEWIPHHPDQDLFTLWVSEACVHNGALTKFDKETTLEGGYKFASHIPTECPVVVRLNNHSYTGDLTYCSGAFVYTFTKEDEKIEVLVLASHFADYWDDIVCLVCMPKAFTPTWMNFSNECQRLAGSQEPTSEVVIIGGRSPSFVPTVDWDDVVLPTQLKEDLLEDVESFFTKGIHVYKRLKLKPFRKLLLAGVPGTGKTMLCSALAKWALDRKYLVIYISSGDRAGSTFGKIEHALAVASRSKVPTLVLLEELDAYLHEEEKALVLNVLDGSESAENDAGTLLVATTNYPEAIDERILKRPGRLDRIYIIPETRDRNDAEKMLRQYLSTMWQEDHAELAQKLVGYPGAFIRELAVYALTLVAYEDLTDLSLEMLERSYKRLREQIEAKDDFLIRRSKGYGI